MHSNIMHSNNMNSNIMHNNIIRTDLYGLRLSQYLPYAGYEFINTVTKGHILKTPVDFDICCAVDVELKNHDNLENITRGFPFCPQEKREKHFPQIF